MFGNDFFVLRVTIGIFQFDHDSISHFVGDNLANKGFTGIVSIIFHLCFDLKELILKRFVALF